MGERVPRLGFLGVGWIGRHRMNAVHAAGAATVAGVADVDPAAAGSAAHEVGCPTVLADLDELLALEPDGIVIATPTALHAEQAARALAQDIPVFCQKPLGRTAAECSSLVALARERDLLLGVDMSYRHLSAVSAAHERLIAGEIGRPHAAELTFHNAYGPDKPWVRDAALAGGGALIDLGCHLLDLARMFMGRLEVASIHSDLFVGGGRLNGDPAAVEDQAYAQITLAGGRVVRIACSWWLPAGTDAVIEATFYGDGRALSVRNLDGSFYDFEALLVSGRSAEQIAAPPDAWGGRALTAWARQLGAGAGFDPDIAELVDVAALIDGIYARGR